MLIVEFFGGPGSGKSTLASRCYSYFKEHCPNLYIEFTREAAQQMIHDGMKDSLQDQLYVLGRQYHDYRKIERQGAQVLFSDTSLLLVKVYNSDYRLTKTFKELVDIIYEDFTLVKVFVKREKPFQSKGRAHSEEQSKELDRIIKDVCHPFDIEVLGNQRGANDLYPFLLSKFENLNV